MDVKCGCGRRREQLVRGRYGDFVRLYFKFIVSVATSYMWRRHGRSLSYLFCASIYHVFLSRCPARYAIIIYPNNYGHLRVLHPWSMIALTISHSLIPICKNLWEPYSVRIKSYSIILFSFPSSKLICLHQNENNMVSISLPLVQSSDVSSNISRHKPTSVVWMENSWIWLR